MEHNIAMFLAFHIKNYVPLSKTSGRIFLRGVMVKFTFNLLISLIRNNILNNKIALCYFKP